MKRPRMAHWRLAVDDEPIAYTPSGDVRFTVRANSEPDRIIRVSLSPYAADRLAEGLTGAAAECRRAIRREQRARRAKARSVSSR